MQRKRTQKKHPLRRTRTWRACSAEKCAPAKNQQTLLVLQKLLGNLDVLIGYVFRIDFGRPFAEPGLLKVFAFERTVDGHLALRAAA